MHAIFKRDFIDLNSPTTKIPCKSFEIFSSCSTACGTVPKSMSPTAAWNKSKSAGSRHWNCHQGPRQALLAGLMTISRNMAVAMGRSRDRCARSTAREAGSDGSAAQTHALDLQTGLRPPLRAVASHAVRAPQLLSPAWVSWQQRLPLASWPPASCYP